ncbi:NUDIX hydrolase [Streptomyces avicenniae]|uniref:NUDIX hydrolase n=1 Tax=Streptomyces avicenniae TaxID=500153 RepID=UPI00069AACCF|nr:NUDIX domain-containing protein [Streptomyces avicenniae]
MATPDFILRLRRSIGNDLLCLPGVSMVVHDDAGRVLLGRRADTGHWSIPGGIPEPGEQPAQTAVREVLEETAVRCVAVRVLLVQTLPPTVYPNGDQVQFTDIAVHCRAVGGEARVNDDESLEVGWFGPDELPPGLSEFALERIRLAGDDLPTWFEPAGPVPAVGG